MKSICVLDWYTSKYSKIDWIDEIIFSELKQWDMVVYSSEDKESTSKLSIWTNIWFEVDTDRQWKFDRILQWDEKKYFDEQQKYALSIFPSFKDTFGDSFEWSIPITARFNIFSNQVYFYFYSEERYVFSEYVKNFRQKIWKNIFLFQVGARDMIRLDPSANDLLCIDWSILHCKTYRPLPNVEMENVAIQSLEWRDIEKLKWRCGKLKCSLIYEADLYSQELKNFPSKWSTVKVKNSEIIWIVISINIMNKDVKIKTDSWENYKFPVDMLRKIKDPINVSEEVNKSV